MLRAAGSTLVLSESCPQVVYYDVLNMGLILQGLPSYGHQLEEAPRAIALKGPTRAVQHSPSSTMPILQTAQIALYYGSALC